MESREESSFPPAHKSRGLGSWGQTQKYCKGERADCMWQARASSRSIWSQAPLVSIWRMCSMHMLSNCFWHLAHWKTCQVWTSQIVQGTLCLSQGTPGPLLSNASVLMWRLNYWKQEFLPSSTKSCSIDCKKRVTQGKKIHTYRLSWDLGEYLNSFTKLITKSSLGSLSVDKNNIT